MGSQRYQTFKQLGLTGGLLLLFQAIFWVDLVGLEIRPVLAETPDPRRTDQCEGVDCPRGDLDPNTPYIISPRNSYILSDRPLIRWYQVEGATRYLVKIQGPNLQWQIETTDPFITYDGENLVRGEEYSIVISTHDGKHKDRASFLWLTDETEQEIQEEIATLSRDLTPQEEVFAIAAIYEKHFLFNDAIAVLEAHLEEFGATTAIYEKLVYFYGQISLNNKVKFYQEQISNLTPSP